MRVATSLTTNSPAASPPTLPDPTAKQPDPQTGTTAIPMRRDRIAAPSGERSEHGGRIAELGAWVKDEWSTVAGAAHGLMSAPGVVSNAWLDAATTNHDLAKKIGDAVDGWPTRSASARQVAIDDLRRAAASVNETANGVAEDLNHANRAPLAVEKTLDAIGELPKDVQQSVNSALAGTAAAAKNLPAPIEARARNAAAALEVAAAAQATKASGIGATTSRMIGTTVGGVDAVIADANNTGSLLRSARILADIPVAGLIFTAGAIAYDVHGGKSVADAAVANVGAQIVGTAVGGAVSAGLASAIGGAALTDGSAVAMGAVVATGPVGWAVAAGVVAGAAAGYGIYKAVESQAGQEIVDGIAHADAQRIEHGLGEARTDIRDAVSSAARWITGSADTPRS